MIEKKSEPICIYDQERMIVGSPTKLSNGRLYSKVYCSVCTNRVEIPADKLVCPACFSNFVVGAGNWLCSNPDCSSYMVKESNMTNSSESDMTLVITWIPRETELARFNVYKQKGYITGGEVWLAPTIITYLAVSIIEKYIENNNLKLKLIKPGSQYARS